MVKSIIKEIIIMLLLTLAIIMVLGLILYEYVPMSKVVPEPVSYTTPENVKEELMQAGTIDESEVIMTYEIDSTDLNNYKSTNNYNPGKANPFSTYDVQEENTESTTAEGTNPTTSSGGTSATGTTSGTGGSSSGVSSSSGGTGTTTINSNNGSSTSEGRFFQDKGTK